MQRWSAGLLLKDRVRQEQVCVRMAVGELTKTLKENRLWWLGHVMSREKS